MIKPCIYWMLIVMATGLCLWSPRAAAAPPGEGELSVTMAGSHIWRGEIVTSDPVIQPSLFVDFDPYALTIWGSWDLEAKTNYAQRARVNVTVDALYESGEHIFRSGVTAFLYQNSMRHAKRNTVELFFGYTLDRLLLPTVTAHYDLGHFNGLYVLCTTSHTLDIIEDALWLYTRLGLGWGNEQYVQEFFSLPRYSHDKSVYTPKGPAFLDLTFSIEMPMRFTEQFKVVPGLTYMHLLDANLRDALKTDRQDADNLRGSLSLILEF